MENISEDEDQDMYESSYYHFINRLKVLAASPAGACELLGHFNVAFETKFDLENAAHLFNYESCTLSPEQRKAIIELVESLNTIPQAVLIYTDVSSMSLRNMDHPCWIPLRKKAQILLELLRPNTEKNHFYFYGEDINA